MDLDYANYFQFFVALVFVLGLIGLVALLMRIYGPGSAMHSIQRRAKGKPRRLEIVDGMSLDARRKLILVRRDSTEHLILLSAHQDLLVESGITSPPLANTSESNSFNEINRFSSIISALRNRNQ